MLSQKKLKEENGGMDVFSDTDVFNQTRVLIGAGEEHILFSRVTT